MTSTLTVIIPNYNGEKFLDSCIESVLQSNDKTPTTEILIIDNGSTDKSLTNLKKRYKDIEKVDGEKINDIFSIKLISLPTNTGFTGAVNTGIMNSYSEFVVLLNNDTKVYPDFLTNLYEAIIKDDKIFSVSSKMLTWDDETILDDAGDEYTVFGFAYGRGKGKNEAEYNKACEVFSACGGASIYRRSVFTQIGIFDDEHFAYLEDLDVGYRARIFGYTNMYEPSAKVIHYGSASSGSRYNEFKTVLSAANNIYVVNKNMPLLQLIFNLPFLIVGFTIKYLFFLKKGMGKSYLYGLCKGFKKSFSKAGRANHVKYRISHSPQYFKIQMSLFKNIPGILK